MFDVNGSRNSSPSSYTHTQLTLTDCSRASHSWRGGALWLVRSLHTTEEVLLLQKKKLCIPQKRYTKTFLWFWNRDFSKPRYTLKPVIVQCLMYMTLFFQMNTIRVILRNVFLHCISYIKKYFFALSIERTRPDLHFTTDYILYNWVCDE